MAFSIWFTVQPLLDTGRLTVAIDDTPTLRYGPKVEGCGLHHNPSRGSAGEKLDYGHVWVTLAGSGPVSRLGYLRSALADPTLHLASRFGEVASRPPPSSPTPFARGRSFLRLCHYAKRGIVVTTVHIPDIAERIHATFRAAGGPRQPVN
jgi:hypothetical protein